jgi:hypothetical protein
MKKNETPAAGSKISMPQMNWKWVAIVGGLCGILAFLITWLAVNPTFDLREKNNNVTEKVVISNPVAAFPPVNLIYTVADNGELKCEYMPSPLYSLQTIRTVDFITPLIWAPRKTYYPIQEGSKLVDHVVTGNLQHQEMDDGGFAIWAAGRHSSGESGTMILTWKVSNFSDNVRLSPYPYNDYVRVDISNPNDYNVQYLAVVESPPIKINTVYRTETKGIVASYVPPPGSPQTSSFPQSLEIRSTGNTGDTFKVNVPFVIDIPRRTEQIVDIQIKEQPLRIALIEQPPVATAPPPPTLWWVWAIIAIGAISVIVVLNIVLTRRRHRP